jgi:ubiquinone/menaquinone biosynthesis C-methylase UbiE
MTTAKTDKELAYIHDLFVAPDWGERFSTLIDDNLTLPAEGDAVYLGSGTGGHALALAERAGPKLNLVGVDESESSVSLSNEKTSAAKLTTRFRHENLEHLTFEDESFDLVIADSSLVALKRLRQVVPEIVRIAKPGAEVLFVVPTAPSFGEFFSLYWEALQNLGLVERAIDVEKLIQEVPTIWQMEELAVDAGLQDIESITENQEFAFDSGTTFLDSPLIANFLLEGWLVVVPEEWRERVIAELARLIDEDKHGADFVLTVKATLIKGRKARSH